MIQSKSLMIIALFLPLVSMICLAGYKKIRLSTGKEAVLPIGGYDLRDLLPGHYLRYRVDYGIENLCSGHGNQEVYVCLDNKQISFSAPRSCGLFIRGNCKYSNFEAGIERYYVPESDASRLESLIRDKEASILISVSSDGTAQIKDLLISGHPWR